MSDPCRIPSSTARDRSIAARSEKAERERRVVEGLRSGLAMAEIARREGITERGMRKYVRNLIARRAPEATGEFIAVQTSRLNEALLVSFGAMSGQNLAAVDRVVRIVRELDRYHGFDGGARGTEARRKYLESLVSGAEAPPLAGPEQAGDAEADVPDDWAELLGDCLPRDARPGEHGTARLRNPLESLVSGAEAPSLAGPGRGEEQAAGRADPDWAELFADCLPLDERPGERGTESPRNPLKSLDSGADATASPLAGPGWGECGEQAAGREADQNGPSRMRGPESAEPGGPATP